MEQKTGIIYGIHPLLEALTAPDPGVERIFILPGRKGDALQRILQEAARKKIPVSSGSKPELDRLSGGATHQGVLGVCRPFTYADVDAVIGNRHGELQHGLILILDGITDPQNLGALIRTVHCLGGSGVIIPAHGAASVTPAVMKASAGAAELTPVAMVTNLVQTLKYLQEKGFWIYGTDAGSGPPLDTLAFDHSVGLVMGSEGTGMRPLVRKTCDFLVSIPMRGRIESLNVSVAAGIALYEIMRRW